MDVDLKNQFEHFFKQREMSFDIALDFVMRDFLVRYQVRILNDRMDDFNLSPREKEVMRLLYKGKHIKEIADALFSSVNTVKKHLHFAYRKCEVENRIELINKLRFL